MRSSFAWAQALLMTAVIACVRAGVVNLENAIPNSNAAEEDAAPSVLPVVLWHGMGMLLLRMPSYCPISSSDCARTRS